MNPSPKNESEQSSEASSRTRPSELEQFGKLLDAFFANLSL